QGTSEPSTTGFVKIHPVAWRVMESHGRLERDGVAAVRRSDVLSNDDWYDSAFFDAVRRPCRLDDTVYSARVLSPRFCDGVTVLPAWGDPAFTEEDVEIIRLFNFEVVRQFPMPGAARRPELPPPREGNWSPRESETLALLLTGASEKRVAARLGLSQ